MHTTAALQNAKTRTSQSSKRAAIIFFLEVIDVRKNRVQKMVQINVA
jgi:hypothetical protein